MKIKYFNHASISVRSSTGKFSLLTDPWTYGPIYSGSMWPFPEPNINRDEYFSHDAIYISHTHPDHYSPNTLKNFSRKIKIFIRQYEKEIPFKKELNFLGFKNIYELQHREKINISKDFFITSVHDKETVDSLLIVENAKKTFLMQNDCFLKSQEYKWISKNYKIDLAGIFFMGIGPNPGSFTLPWYDKEKIVKQKKLDNFYRALRTTNLLGAKKVFPCSNDMIWFRRPDLAILNGALPYDFKMFLKEKKNKDMVIILNSGDVFDIKLNKLRQINYRDRFKTKNEQLNRYFDNYFNKKIKGHIVKLSKWEEKYKFKSEQFFKLFSIYIKHLNVNKKNELKKLKNFRIGLRIKNENNKIFCFVLSLMNKKFTFQNKKKLSDLYSDSHLVLQINGNLVKMALEGIYTFEDLENCSYLIDRFNNQYTYEEQYFWKILSEFNWFLKNKGYSQNSKELLRYQINFNKIKV